MLLLVSWLLAGCATTSFQAHVEKRDPASPNVLRQHSDTIRIKNVQPMDKSYAMFRMNYTSMGQQGAWSLSTIYNGGNWLLVRSLRFEVDGQLFEFDSLPDPVREIGKIAAGEATEQNIFTVPESFLLALSRADEASVLLIGDNERVGRRLSARDLHNIAWYVQHVIEYRHAPRPGEADPFPG